MLRFQRLTPEIASPTKIWPWAISFILLTTLCVGVIVRWPAARAQLAANCGSILQTQAELSVYHWPQWGLQDQVRDGRATDLSKAIARYQTSLDIDPTNATANRRLGQIELSRGDFVSARHHLKAAFDSSPNQRATRQLLGEIYALEGHFVQANQLWREIDVSHSQLEVRLWWYQHYGSPQQVQRMTQAISLFKVRPNSPEESQAWEMKSGSRVPSPTEYLCNRA
jgi:tetratricopeptide (TPR) repeat protein